MITEELAVFAEPAVLEQAAAASASAAEAAASTVIPLLLAGLRLPARARCVEVAMSET